MATRIRFAASGQRWLFVQLAGLVLLCLLVCPVVYAHSDLEVQIDEISRQLVLSPDDPELLLRRGDLQRRHENWDLARADYSKVREVQPDNSSVDWFEGRMEVEAGRPQVGVELLNRYLLSQPQQVIALQNRAQGYLLLDQGLLAARDYQTVIQVSDNPAPTLFSANALAFAAAGVDYFPDAMIVAQQGLAKFPGEMSLTEIATDLSLAQADTDRANLLLSELPESIQQLPQWQFRIALSDCLAGNASSLVAALETLATSRSALSEEWSSRLANNPDAAACQAAAAATLTSR